MHVCVGGIEESGHNNSEDSDLSFVFAAKVVINRHKPVYTCLSIGINRPSDQIPLKKLTGGPEQNGCVQWA